MTDADTTRKNPKGARRAGTMANDIDDNTILCACTNFTVGQIRALIGSGLDSFDTLLEKSGAGRGCTACLLDLEYYATHLKNSADLSVGKSVAAVTEAEKTPFRHKIYRIIDRMSPSVHFPLRDFVPVFVGDGIRQRLIIANDSLCYEGVVSAPPIETRVIIRDDEGVIRHQKTYRVDPEAELNLCVSKFLPPVADREIGVGCIEVHRKAVTSGFRGTTRPQILIEAPLGSCAVHGQDNSRPGDNWFTFYVRPGVDRFFFCIFNNTGRILDYEVAYPFATTDQEVGPTVLHHVPVPPYGARMHEFRLPDESVDRLAGKLIRIRLANKQAGGRKVFLLCASHDLKQFSIDHASS